MELATRALATELRRAGIPYIRVHTGDPADQLGNRGRWTAHNVRLAIRHLLEATRKTFRRDVAVVYVPIAQEFPALIRDMVFLLSAQVARKRTVVHLHGGAFEGFYASQRGVVRGLLRVTVGRASLGIVLTPRLRSSLECVLPAERVVEVANGIDLEVTSRRRTTQDEVRVLFLSALYRWKGTFVFIEAFARAHALRPHLRGILAGEWPSAEIREEALDLARRLHIEDRLTFTGGVSQVEKRDVLESADIFCFPSQVPEGQPLVILEAMAAGLPVVAPNWPGIADTVVPGETGILVGEPSPDAFAEAIVYLVDHPGECRRLGAAARTRHGRLYTQTAFGQRMAEALEPLLTSQTSTRKTLREAL